MKVVCALLLNDDDQVLIAKRGAHKSNPGEWEFPGGKIEDGERPEDALRRELKEELCIEIHSCIEKGSISFQNKEHPFELIGISCRSTSAPSTSTDHDELRFVEWSELHNYRLSKADKKFIQVHFPGV